tara:strand:- start:1314 stop:2579 length:1266 start_codon:yes stop_codon:yes gene_type:complete
MQLTLARHPISEIQLNGPTRLEGTTLFVDVDGLRQVLLADTRLEGVDIDAVRPGENCRAGPVFDVIEPRAKESGLDFPGILSAHGTAGIGTTHVLEGAAVTVLDGGPHQGPLRSILEMSGPAAEYSAYSELQHLVVTPRVRPELARHIALNATHRAGLQASVYLAQAGFGQAPALEETYESVGPAEPGREGLPRTAYVGQFYSRQYSPEADEQILYGSNTEGMAPMLLHPDEWLDGAVVPSYSAALGGAETYFYQNSPVITDLYRRHHAGELNFVGTVATIAGADNADRDMNCQIASNLTRWALKADAAVLTKYGGGVPHADMAETARLLEGMGIRTAVMVSDLSRDRRVESALLFNFPEIDAIVYLGGNDTSWTVPPVERVIAGNPQAAEALAVSQEFAAAAIAGVSNQQGAGRLMSAIY